MNNKKNYNSYLYKGFMVTVVEVNHLIPEMNGGWNGYAGVPKGHPLFQLNYGDEMPGDESGDWIESYFQAHGGITFSGFDYWNYNVKPFVIKDQELKSWMKAYALRTKLGNVYLPHYRELGIDPLSWNRPDPLKRAKGLKHPLALPAVRARFVFDNIMEFYPKPQSIHYIEDGVDKVTTNFAVCKTDEGDIELIAATNDYWYFGWDCCHYGDNPRDFSRQRSELETKKLIDQIINWTKKNKT